MRPSLYHGHTAADGRRFLGEDDVHGARLGPRYRDFAALPGLRYVAYADHDAERDAALAAATAVNRGDYGTLRYGRPVYDFAVAAADHVVYAATPMPCTGPPADTRLVLWWRRPRATTTKLARDPYDWPWPLDTQPVRLFRRDTGELAMVGVVRAWQGPEYARGATGYAVLDVQQLSRGGETRADVARAWQKIYFGPV